jgi:hypothetical protein
MGFWRRRLLGLAIAFAAALAVSSGTAVASKWTVRQLPPPSLEGSSSPDRVLLYSVSCPSESLCVATGALDTIAVSQRPTGGADSWHVVNPTYDEPKQSCLEEEGVPAASCERPRGAIDAVACAGEALCVAVGYEGSVFTSTDPAGGAGAWSVSDVNTPGSGTHLTAVSCPSASLCVAVSGGNGAAAGRVLTSSDPASESWQATQLPESPDLRGVSCATPELCVAVAKEGRIFVSSDPAGGASAWRERPSPTPRDLQAVACLASLCVAGDEGGNLLTSTDPLGGAPFSATNTAGSILITGIACPTATRCVAVDNNADVLTSTDPLGGPSSWTFENLVPFVAEDVDYGQFVKNALFGASCPTTSLCALVGADSRIFTATDPFAAPAPSPSAGSPGKRAKRRPRTHLVFAEHFWKSSITNHRHIKARFRFYSRDGARAFLCKPDRRRWRRCHSPLRYWVPVGRHILRVRAIGSTGLPGPIASARFEVTRPRHSLSARPGA